MTNTNHPKNLPSITIFKKIFHNELLEDSPRSNLKVTNKPKNRYGIRMNLARFAKKFLGTLLEYLIPNKTSDNMIKQGVANNRTTCIKLTLIF